MFIHLFLASVISDGKSANICISSDKNIIHLWLILIFLLVFSSLTMMFLDLNLSSSCLIFTKFFEFLDFCFSTYLGSSQLLVHQIIFFCTIFYLTFWDSYNMNVRPGYIALRLCLFIFYYSLDCIISIDLSQIYYILFHFQLTIEPLQ